MSVDRSLMKKIFWNTCCFVAENSVRLAKFGSIAGNDTLTREIAFVNKYSYCLVHKTKTARLFLRAVLDLEVKLSNWHGAIHSCRYAYWGFWIRSLFWISVSRTPKTASWRWTDMFNAANNLFAVKKFIMMRCLTWIGSLGIPTGCGFKPKSTISSSGEPVTRQKLA